MDAPGISDSMGEQRATATCATCGGQSRVGRSLCLSCLLQQGLDPEVESSGLDPHLQGAETLDAILTQMVVPTTSWRLGNYEIQKEIGRGGMGVIYRARQRYSGRIVALKRLLGYHADSRETLARFRREAQAAASLDHPNILPIYEVGETEENVPFFTMKLASGGSLADAAAGLRNEPRRCVALMARVARAIGYAHGKGVLHRDLKPGNILLDGHGNPMVGDFGLAKWINATSDLTHTLTIFGTPGYIAPEQATDSTAVAAPAADIYSLGAILFDLLAGRPPFLGSHAVSVIRQATEKDAPKLRSLCDVADRDLETICARCLEREPSARYRSADDLAEDLDRWIEGRPIVARPVSTPIRAWRWSRRNPRLALSFAAIALLSGGALTSTIVNARLSSIVQQAEMARHSIVITPFEDLDEVSPASVSAQSTTRAFIGAFKAASGIQASFAAGAQTDKDRDPWSPEQWKRIGEAAGARMVLSGSLRTREGKQHLALHLIETATGSVVKTWMSDQGAAFSEPPNSTFAQALLLEISRLLDDSKTGETIVTGDTGNSLARSYYDRGKEFFFRYNLPDQERAIESFRKAIEIDPNYGQAYAMLATTCQLRANTDPDGSWVAEAEKAAANALRIAPMLPEAHNAHAGNLRDRGLHREALDSFLTAYELDPSSSRAPAKLGSLYNVLGRLDLAVLWFEKAARRETRPIYDDNIASVWTVLGEYDKAERAYQSSAVFRPDLPVSALGLSYVSLYRGSFEDAQERCAAARLKYQNNPTPLMLATVVEFFTRRYTEAEKLCREAMESNRTGSVEFVGAVRYLSVLGFILRNAGAEPEGKQLLEEARSLDEQELARAPENPQRLYSLAANQAALGDTESAFATLNKAVAAGWVDYRPIELDPRFDSIRETEAFKEIVSQLKQRIRTMKERFTI